MSVPADEDVVTMGANAAYPLQQAGELEEVELLLFATESGLISPNLLGYLSIGYWA